MDPTAGPAHNCEMTADGARWRPMTPADLTAVTEVAGLVHPDYPEDLAVLAERQALYPPGCFMLEGLSVQGYAFSHPWRFGQPPKLNTRLHRLPDDADTFYIHDVAILPDARSGGHGAAIVALLAGQAAGMGSLSLVAVGHSMAFWLRHGFRPCENNALRTALVSYDEGARFMVRPLPR